MLCCSSAGGTGSKKSLNVDSEISLNVVPADNASNSRVQMLIT